MDRLKIIAIALAAASLHISQASAGPYSDDVVRCFMKSSSAEDKTLFMQWSFAELSLNPSVQALSAVTDEQRAAFTKQLVKYYERLLFTDCRQQAIDAVKFEGPTAVTPAFSMVGQVATRELLSDPKTRAGMKALIAGIDKQKLVEIYGAGSAMPAPDAQAAK
jgi:hypothetical protein